MAFQTVEKEPKPEAYRALRVKAGLSPKTAEAASRGLGNAVYAVTLYDEQNLIGMGRIIGDGGCHYQIVDIAVDPDYQGRGLGREVMSHLLTYLKQNAPSSAYVSLIADQPTFYQKLGFLSCSPDSEGMFMKIP